MSDKKETKPNRFKTVMVEDSDRDAFSTLRDELTKKNGVRVTDKQLFTAVFANANLDAVNKTIATQQKITVAAREEKKIERLQAKIASMKAGE